MKQMELWSSISEKYMKQMELWSSFSEKHYVLMQVYEANGAPFLKNMF